MLCRNEVQGALCLGEASDVQRFHQAALAYSYVRQTTTFVAQQIGLRRGGTHVRRVAERAAYRLRIGCGRATMSRDHGCSA